MEEELEKEESVNVQTVTETSAETETNQALDSLPRIEDLRKSEQEVNINTKIEGVKQVEQRTKPQDRIFTKKTDEKKVYIKKRLKIVTAVYSTVVALLLAFVITNIATLAILDNRIESNTKTIKSQKDEIVKVLEENPNVTPGEGFQISLNEPRVYSEYKQELTYLDKLTILFRNLFG